MIAFESWMSVRHKARDVAARHQEPLFLGTKSESEHTVGEILMAIKANPTDQAVSLGDFPQLAVAIATRGTLVSWGRMGLSFLSAGRRFFGLLPLVKSLAYAIFHPDGW